MARAPQHEQGPGLEKPPVSMCSQVQSRDVPEASCRCCCATPGKSEQFQTWQELGLEVTLLLPLTPPRPSGEAEPLLGCGAAPGCSGSELPNTPLTADSTPHLSGSPQGFPWSPTCEHRYEGKKWQNRW
uniref:Uncharacterized protein n=1 Tax=Rousettus aegyptiacus TaxID=9407 RepID=A0A7J8DXK2_ROUAE|nr:hypothetical protein HJG63_008334 [Rousettus aegyptiacus]